MVVVDLYGQCADFDSIVPLCREFGIVVIEDAAEALGSTYHGRPAGTLGDIGVFSFNGNKIVTTGGGGMLVSPSVEIAERACAPRDAGAPAGAALRAHEAGYNYRLANLLAAVGRAQLERLPSISARRLAINARYRELLADLPGVSFMPLTSYGTWNGWITCVVFGDSDTRSAVGDALADLDIESRPLWKPMHLQPAFRHFESRTDGTSERLFHRGLCLPSGGTLTDDQVDLVGSTVASVCERSALALLTPTNSS